MTIIDVTDAKGGGGMRNYGTITGKRVQTVNAAFTTTRRISNDMIT